MKLLQFEKIEKPLFLAEGFQTNLSKIEITKMFVIKEISTAINIYPQDFGKNIVELIENDLNRRLPNRIIHNIGLGMYLHEIVKIGDTVLSPSVGQ
jgi:hypothetical protein